MKIHTLLIITSVIFLSGCGERFVRIHDRYPIYNIPPKAKIEIVTSQDLSALKNETKTKIVKTVKELKKEAAALRAILKSYNDYAKDKNDEYDAIIKKMHDSQ